VAVRLLCLDFFRTVLESDRGPCMSSSPAPVGTHPLRCVCIVISFHVWAQLGVTSCLGTTGWSWCTRCLCCMGSTLHPPSAAAQHRMAWHSIHTHLHYYWCRKPYGLPTGGLFAARLAPSIILALAAGRHAFKPSCGCWWAVASRSFKYSCLQKWSLGSSTWLQLGATATYSRKCRP
jgi:hypothetical protein